MLNPTRKWLSFYIFLPAMDDVFLMEHLPEIIDRLKAKKLIRRFFFIRYGEGGYHIRLRIMPAKSGGDEIIENEIRASLRRMKKNFPTEKASEMRLEVAGYDRAEHYFGESAQTVYSELINEQTSVLALRLLSMFAGSQKFYAAKILASLYLLMSASSENERDFQKSIEEGINFVINSGYYDASKNESAAIPSDEQQSAAQASIERMKNGFQGFPELEKASRLLFRCRRKPETRFAATHSIHLYLNKMNFSMSQELKLYRLLKKTPREF